MMPHLRLSLGSIVFPGPLAGCGSTGRPGQRNASSLRPGLWSAGHHRSRSRTPRRPTARPARRAQMPLGHGSLVLGTLLLLHRGTQLRLQQLNLLPISLSEVLLLLQFSTERNDGLLGLPQLPAFLASLLVQSIELPAIIRKFILLRLSRLLYPGCLAATIAFGRYSRLPEFAELTCLLLAPRAELFDEAPQDPRALCFAASAKAGLCWSVDVPPLS
mmetsp:Transcript_66013/g.143872  ORF Transcript_66013/g.143872 Transcript_66013/m.143872 type:complete len:217 (+) Transcript_66013:315-965(+)